MIKFFVFGFPLKYKIFICFLGGLYITFIYHKSQVCVTRCSACSLFSLPSVPKLLVDLHVKLLRKIGKSVSADRWEKYLVKVCFHIHTTRLCNKLLDNLILLSLRVGLICSSEHKLPISQCYRWSCRSMLNCLDFCVIFPAGLPGVQHHVGVGARAERIQGDADRVQGGHT